MYRSHEVPKMDVQPFSSDQLWSSAPFLWILQRTSRNTKVHPSEKRRRCWKDEGTEQDAS